MNTSAFILGCITGGLLALGWLTLGWRPRRKSRTASSEPEHRYGHPRPPVSALQSRLPEPPLGHAWEIQVIHDSAGTPFLHLDLLDALSGKVIGEIQRDLINGGFPWQTWAALYRNWSGPLFAGERRSRFDNELIGPMVDWATGQVNRVANANAMGEHIVDAS